MEMQRTAVISQPRTVTDTSEPQKIALSKKNEICLVKAEDIVYLKADGNYTHLFMKNGDRHICSVHLKKFALKLGQAFLRIHQSYLIQAKCMTTYSISECIVKLETGQRVPVSRNKKSIVNNYLRQWLV